MSTVSKVKRCLDYVIKVRVNSTCTGAELKGFKQSTNPFNEIAVHHCSNKEPVERIQIQINSYKS